NNGDGTFDDVAAEVGVEDIGAGMSVSWFDYNNDGADDLYVANMWTAAGERIAAQAIFKKDATEEVRALYRKHAMGNSLFQNKNTNVLRPSSVPPSSSVVQASRLIKENADEHKENPIPTGFRSITDEALVALGRWSWSRAA